MSSKPRRIFTAISLLLVFSTFQVYVRTGLAAPETLSTRTESPRTSPGQQTMGSLTTQGNQPITVNGVSTASGATVLTGANIETPAGVGATVNLGALGSLRIDPNTKLTLDFQNGSVKVMLLQGCVVLNTRQGVTGEISTTQGVVRSSDGSKDDNLSVCAPGAVATGPTTGQTTAGGGGGGGGGLFGLGTAATVAIIGGSIIAVAVPLFLGGSNPSPAVP